MNEFAVMPLDDYKDIAKKIREKTDITETIKSGDVPQKIEKVYDYGRKKIMSGIQNEGGRTNYNHAFFNWRHDAIYPVYDFVCSNCEYMFYNIKGDSFDLSARLKECGVKLDTSACKSFAYTFFSCNSTTMPEIDTRGADMLELICPSTPGLKTIENIILREDGSQTFSSMFDWSSDIESVKITGVIGRNGFDVGSLSKLNRESLLSILNALQDKSEDISGTTWVITLGITNKSKLSDEEIQIAESKGWSVR